MGTMRRWLWLIIMFLGLGFVLRYWEDIVPALLVLRGGDAFWLLLGLVLESGWILQSSTLLFTLYRALHLRESFFRLVVMVVTSFFVNLAAPTGGVSGVALLAADARQRNHSASHALAAGLLYIFFEHAGFVGVMLLGLWVLARRHRLTWAELSAAAIMVFIVLALFLLMALSWRAPRLLARVLGSSARLQRLLLGWLPWADRLPSPEDARRFAHELAAGLYRLRRHPKQLMLCGVLGFTDKFWLIGVMGVAFYAFHLPLSPGTLITAYVIAHLFLVVSPVPGGVGFAEGALMVILTSFGFSLGDAFVVTFTYRALTFWLPFFLGMVGFRYLLHVPGSENVS